jgi:hypothetical protein
MRFPANCVAVTAAAVLLGQRPRTIRNRPGRLHVYWVNRRGEAFEFYTKGASLRSYWRNALTFGEVKRAPSLDEKTDIMKATEIITLAEREADWLEHENDHSAAIIMRELVQHLRSSTTSVMAAVGSAHCGERPRKIV